MKEHSIHFKQPHADAQILALLEGRKTQTRRVINPQPLGYTGRKFIVPDDSPKSWHDSDDFLIFCPYGQPGDRLWVRETTIRVEEHGYVGPVYRASENGAAMLDHGLSPAPDDVTEVEPYDLKLRPSIHMPRSMARILLEVTSVRVERLQNISEADAIAEGAFFTDFGRQCFHDGAGGDAVKCPAPDGHHPRREGWSMVPTESHEQCLPSARMAFANLWESINGSESWEANPWVWVVEFKRINHSEVA